MKILVDSREQRPYSFARFNVETQAATLRTGDYSVVPLHHGDDAIAIERKSLDDLVGCCCRGRERFERELARGAMLRRFFVVVEASVDDILGGRYTSRMKPKAVLASVNAFTVRHNVPFIFSGSRESAEWIVCDLLSRHLAHFLPY